MTPTAVNPTAEAPTAKAPTAKAPTAEAPTAEGPTAEAPTAKAPTAKAPTAKAPTARASTARTPTARASTARTPTALTSTRLRRLAAALRCAHARGTDDDRVRHFLEDAEDPGLWAHSQPGADPGTHARLQALARRLTDAPPRPRDALVLSHSAAGDFFHGAYQRGGRILLLLYFPGCGRGFAYALLEGGLARFRLAPAAREGRAST